MFILTEERRLCLALARELLPVYDLGELPLREWTCVMFRDGRQADRVCSLVSVPGRMTTLCFQC